MRKVMLRARSDWLNLGAKWKPTVVVAELPPEIVQALGRVIDMALSEAGYPGRVEYDPKRNLNFVTVGEIAPRDLPPMNIDLIWRANRLAFDALGIPYELEE